jgi:hypothetical protein
MRMRHAATAGAVVAATRNSTTKSDIRRRTREP